MAAAAQVALIVCGTIVVLVLLAMLAGEVERRRWRGYGGRDRTGLYQRFLAALAEVKCDPTGRGARQRLASAAHAISLAAPPEVVSATIACCREVHERSAPPSAETARSLLLTFRNDLGLPPIADPERLDFDVVPALPTRGQSIKVG